MTDFALRGVFYLGDAGTVDEMVEQADHLMRHLLSVETWDQTIHDAAVSLDASDRTVTVELVVTSESMIHAHNMASIAVSGAFVSMQERSFDGGLVTA